MFLQPNGVLLNKATVYRWGVKIGTVFLTFTKETPAAAERPLAAKTAPVRLAIDNQAD